MNLATVKMNHRGSKRTLEHPQSFTHLCPGSDMHKPCLHTAGIKICSDLTSFHFGRTLARYARKDSVFNVLGINSVRISGGRCHKKQVRVFDFPSSHCLRLAKAQVILPLQSRLNQDAMIPKLFHLH